MTEKANEPHHAYKSPSTVKRSGATVALFGEVLADVFPDRSVLGGAPFNVARHLKAFGLNPVLITRTGNDALRAELLDAMAACGMDTMGVQCDQNYPTGQVKVHFEGGTHRFEILPDQAYDHIHATVARMVALSIHPELVYFGTLAQRHAASRSALKTLLKHSSVPTFFDVNLRSPWYDASVLRKSLQHADTVKLNDEEMSIMAELFGLPGDTLADRARSFIRVFGIGQVLVTCGAEGAWLVQRDGSEVSMMPKGAPITVADTVGAGDGFSAVFMFGQLQGWPGEQILARAHEFAAAICTIRGAAPEQADFYEPFLRAWQS
ncbi:MAG: carbohydrate kinase [Gammaproteobacteria bacterium]|nr:carbohydrate kinase [Gammaproteobacteria bacterium]MBU1624086.1 carbohydrate kinase [Gammaproteobacteria bacterium]MBU1981814.1 carbohydrate kinase [Gammaproteobacteria bacterium]